MAVSAPTSVGLCALAAAFLAFRSTPSAAPTEAWCCFWNVENLFDAVDDPDREDTVVEAAAVAEKVRRLRAVLSRIGWGRGPDVVGFAEVETAALVRDVVGDGYDVLFADGPDRRGIRVALATRLPVRRWEAFLPTETSARNVLHATLTLAERKIEVLVVHLKSRLDRQGETAASRWDEEQRAAEARAIRAKVDALLEADPAAEILCMGDWNEHYQDSLFRRDLLAQEHWRPRKAPTAAEVGDADRRLRNLGPALAQSFPGGGTHYFHPHWSVIDNFVVSEALLEPSGLVLDPNDVAIGVSWDLLNHYGQPGRFDPKARTGVSDHLPIVARIARGR